MAFKPVEYEFPDPDNKSDKESLNIEVEGAVGETQLDPKPTKKKDVVEVIKADDLEIEIVDPTPKADRNRKPSEPPEEVTDDELGQYSEKVKKRIQHFSKGYHDERRAKEQALREREELERYVKAVMDENSQLKGSVNKSQTALVEQAKRAVESEVADAKRKYKEAYEAGDSELLLAAQEALTTAKIRMDRVQNIKVPPLQAKENEVKLPPNPQPAPPTVQQDARAQNWAKNNSWFGDDEQPEMTAFALGLDTKLRREGIDPRSDEYYERIDARMRQVFPDAFQGEEVPSRTPQQRKASSVVAPATRSTAPKKVTLSPSAQAIAKRLGLTLEQYAAQVAELEMKRNG
jgi:hypothetical protein